MELATPEKAWYTSSCGRVELEIDRNDARIGYHQGSCDADISALRQVPYIAAQLAKIDPAALRAELRGYGAWNDAELADHEANLDRVLWLACGDIVDNPED